MKEKILKHRLSSEELFHQIKVLDRSNCLPGLNEYKSYFSKFLLVTRQREGFLRRNYALLYSFTRKDISQPFTVFCYRMQMCSI